MTQRKRKKDMNIDCGLISTLDDWLTNVSGAEQWVLK